MSLLNRIVKSDGQEIGPSSIVSLSYTETVNSGSNLEPGCVSVATLEIVYRQGVALTYGDEFEYHVVDSESGNDTLIGVFIAEKPSRESATTYAVTAYDKLSKSEKDLSEWLNSIQDQFPIQLYSFTKQVCEQCGLTLKNAELLNGDHMIRQFYADGITGRQLLSWAAQATATFCRCSPFGEVSFEWYTPIRGAHIASGTKDTPVILRLAGDRLRTSLGETYRILAQSKGYFADSLQYEDYVSEAPVKVQIRQADDDVGTVYPPDEERTNALVIQNNMLLGADSANELTELAENIYSVMADTSYTPFSAELPMTLAFRAGNIISVYAAAGASFKTYVQSCSWNSGRMTLTATGNPTRDSSGAVNSKAYENLDGKLLRINADVNGLTVTSVKKGEVRSEFALDDSSVHITSGLIAFDSNTIEINSDNFTLTQKGDVSASGSFSSSDEYQESVLSQGGVFVYKDGDLCTAVHRFSGGTAGMGSVLCYGPGTSGGRVTSVILRADTSGGVFSLQDANGSTVIQMTEGVIFAKGLGVSGEKNRIVETSYGKVKFHALESPQPNFQDFGSGVCGSDGTCLLTLDPRFAEAVSERKPPLWYVTPTSEGIMWVENGVAAIVHGAPNQTFNWMVCAPQRGYEDQYADPWKGL